MTRVLSTNGGGRKPLVTTAGRALGYARVSTDGQSLDGQLATLKAAGAVSVYREKISGARADRPQLHQLIAGLRPGDVLLVVKLDRLGRSTRDVLNLIHRISEAGAAFRSIGDPMFDTGGPQGKLLLAIMAAVAEFERSLIISRTSEGRARAKARGVIFGRPPVLSPHQRAEAARRKANGEPLGVLAQSYGCSISTIARLGATP